MKDWYFDSNMSKSRTSELEDYLRRIGEHITFLNSKIDEMNSRIRSTEDSVTQLRDSVTQLRDNIKSTPNPPENSISKAEFDEFVTMLTESLENIAPSETRDVSPLPKETEGALCIIKG